MALPEPTPGLVIGYSYLWRDEAQAGREEGAKDRPCAIILVAKTSDGRKRVGVLPITHALPRDPSAAIEIPPAVKRRLGLDSERSWVVISEINEFTWPGHDLRQMAREGGSSVIVGPLPPGFFRFVRDRFVARYQARKVANVPRTA